MCLIVREVPTSKTAGLIVQCYKALNYYNNSFTTWYLYAHISRTGWIFPKRKSTKTEMYHSDSLEGGWIHGYTVNHGPWSTRDAYKAYAFRVTAYGACDDLVCSAMYIPQADLSDNRESTTAAIKKLLAGSRLTRKQVANLHPRLIDFI